MLFNNFRNAYRQANRVSVTAVVADLRDKPEFTIEYSSESIQSFEDSKISQYIFFCHKMS